MGFNAKLVNGGQVKTGNLDTLVAGTITGGNALAMQNVEIGSLSATVTVDAETNTITIAALWEVSQDNSTWLRCSGAPNNPAEVVLATGTAGADAAVTRVVPAPPAVYGYRFARCSVLNGVATGGASDTYSIGYNYQRKSL